jgi:hypothetical protein
VLYKNQALAAADALILKAEAERLRRLERRTARWKTLYPVIKAVPMEEMEALVREAESAIVTRWVVGIAALLTVFVGLWAFLGIPFLDIEPMEPRPYPLAMAAAALIAPAQFFCTRAFLRREVPKRYPSPHAAAGLGS